MFNILNYICVEKVALKAGELNAVKSVKSI